MTSSLVKGKRKSGRLDAANHVLSKLADDLRSFAERSDFPPFGADLGFINHRQVADVVVIHRIANKFEVPSLGAEKTRRETSIRAALERDKANAEYHFKLTDHMRLARARLGVWFKDFKPTYRLVVPNGESSLSSEGETDFLSKLANEQAWEISPELIDYAFQIVWKNHALKRMVRARFARLYPKMTLEANFREKHGPSGFHCFREKFKSLCTINAVSRMTTVPKNNSEDRVITCEPLWNMIAQLSFMRDIRAHMRRVLGYDINTRGDLHKSLIAQDCATIDLRAASDMVTCDLVRNLWPTKMWAYLEKLRPKLVEWSDGNHVDYHSLHMFAPMGTGITFDIMSFTILAILRFDRSASVFGDDIIVKQESVREALLALTDAGLVVNNTKSFIRGRFRESCGGMYHDDIGYIVSYDIRSPKDICDLIAIVNKLRLIIEAKQISFELEGILLTALIDLYGMLPRVVFACMPTELSASEVTGLNWPKHFGKGKESEGWLHRRPYIHVRCVKVSYKSSVSISEELEWMGVLFRGLVTRVKRKTHIVQETVDTWSGGLLKGQSFQPI